MNSVVSAIKNTVSISQFNRGMAGKVFGEVKKSGPKVVIKNNEPICVIISPEEYVKFMEELEDAYMYMTSQDRLSHFKPDELVSEEDVFKEFGIKEEDLAGYDEVEFE